MENRLYRTSASVSQRVDLRFNDRPVRVPQGVTLFDAASWNGIAIDSTCGGHGTCKKCRIRFKADAPVPTSLDLRAYTTAEIKDGWRLACRTPADHRRRRRGAAARHPAQGGHRRRRPPGHPPPRRPQALPGARRAVARRPGDRPRTGARRADRPRPRPPTSPSCATSAARCAQSDFKVTAVVADETLIAVEPGDTTGRAFGLAFDLGTTTVVATLLDLTTGTPVAVESMLNKQQPFGADVIARISATMLDPAARDQLRQLAQETLAELAAAACQAGGVLPRGGLRGRPGRQRHHGPPGPRHRPGAARRRPVHPVRPPAARGPRPRPGSPRPPAGPRGGLSRVRRVRRRRHHRRPAGQRHGPRPAHPPVHRHRHQLRDRPRRPRLAAAPPPPRPARPSRARRSAAACAPPTAPSRRSRSPATATSSSPSSATPTLRACAAPAWSMRSPPSPRPASSTNPAVLPRTRLNHLSTRKGSPVRRRPWRTASP